MSYNFFQKIVNDSDIKANLILDLRYILFYYFS